MFLHPGRFTHRRTGLCMKLQDRDLLAFVARALEGGCAVASQPFLRNKFLRRMSI